MTKLTYRRKSLIEVPEVYEYILIGTMTENGRHGVKEEIGSLHLYHMQETKQKASKL